MKIEAMYCQQLTLTKTTLTLEKGFDDCHGYRLKLSDLKKALKGKKRQPVVNCLAVKQDMSLCGLKKGQVDKYGVYLHTDAIGDGVVASIGCVEFQQPAWNKILSAMKLSEKKYGYAPIKRAKAARA